MFGYVTICEPELKVKDLKKYRAYYCGLCRELKEEYGFMGQMTLTYDMTFAIILLSSLYENIADMEMHRCKVHPVKKQMMLRNEITSYAAAMNVLLAYYHMDDDWRDDRKLTSFMTKSVIHGKVKKIIEQYPRQSETIRTSLTELAACEKENSMDIDRTGRRRPGPQNKHGKSHLRRKWSRQGWCPPGWSPLRCRRRRQSEPSSDPWWRPRAQQLTFSVS